MNIQAKTKTQWDKNAQNVNWWAHNESTNPITQKI